MKKRIAILLAFALAVLPAVAEGAAPGFRDGIAWGMTVQAVTDAESGHEIELDREAGFEVLEVDDSAQYGITCDVEYFFRGDALVACVCEYDTEDVRADFQSLSDALTGDHGAPVDSPDPERWRLLEDILDGEMEPRPADRFSCWELSDGTLIALVEDVGDESIRLGFYDELKLVESAL